MSHPGGDPPSILGGGAYDAKILVGIDKSFDFDLKRHVLLVRDLLPEAKQAPEKVRILANSFRRVRS